MLQVIALKFKTYVSFEFGSNPHISEGGSNLIKDFEERKCLWDTHYQFSIKTLLSRRDESPRATLLERWGAGVETQKNVRGEIGGWGREPFHENYAPSLSTIYDGA